MIMPFVDIPGQTDWLGAWGLGGLDPIEERVEVPGVSYIGLRSLIVYPNFSSIFKGMMFIADPQSNMILDTGMS